MALCRERHYPRLQKNDDRVALRPAAEPGLGPPPTTLAWAVRRQLFGIRSYGQSAADPGQASRGATSTKSARADHASDLWFCALAPEKRSRILRSPFQVSQRRRL